MRLPRSTVFPYTTLFRSGEVVPGVPPRTLGALLTYDVDPLVPEPSREPQEDLLEGVHLEPAQGSGHRLGQRRLDDEAGAAQDRKSTRLNSSHVEISYAVF